jgi:p70 ribosomal S6 kinase
MLSNSQKKKKKKSLHSLLATNLGSKLTISIPSSTQDPELDFDFSEVFGPSTPHNRHPHQNPIPSSSPPSTSSPTLPPADPPVIRHRSHSFVGPSPRFTLSRSLPIQTPESESESESESDAEARNGPSVDVEKFGPGDFEILRVVGQGAFGKVFQVVRKARASASASAPNNGECKGGGDDDGIYAMKVMRKDTIIKKNHVDYMKAERDILTKVVHPFIVQLRYSFQVHTLST